MKDNQNNLKHQNVFFVILGIVLFLLAGANAVIVFMGGFKADFANIATLAIAGVFLATGIFCICIASKKH